MAWKDTTKMEKKIEFINEWRSGQFSITELSRPQGRHASPKQFSLVRVINAVGDGFNVSEDSTEESNGVIPEGLPGSKNVACSVRSIRNLVDPSTSSDLPIGGRTVQSQKGCPTGQQSEGSQIIS